MIKEFLQFWAKSLPMVVGLMCVLVALAFLVSFADNADFDVFEEEEFWGFVLFALIGLPLTLFGINRLSSK